MQSRELKSMLESHVANMQLTTAKEIKRSHKDKNVTFGKPIYAEVRIEYEPTVNHKKEDVYNEIVKNIESNGWRRDEYNVLQRGYYSASLSYESFSLVVEVFDHPDTSTVRIVMGQRARQMGLQ